MESGITVKKENNFGEWYRQILTKTDYIRYYEVKGCYVLLPSSYKIWTNIQSILDKEFKKLGVENCYFPLFVTERNLSKEESHLEGFKAEVAWIDKKKEIDEKNKDNKDENKKNEDKKDRIAVRPTSECIIYPVLTDMIRSYKDLPIKYNQWCNVVRWEFKDTIPFIRSREFLWQEGHTAFFCEFEAQKEVTDMIDIYKQTYEKYLSVPVVKGIKTKKETFAGAEYTYTIESYIPCVGKGIQCATSHHLGQNFSKMFNLEFLNKEGKKEYCYQNSWGFTTRSIGVMIQEHSDNKGLVITTFYCAIANSYCTYY